MIYLIFWLLIIICLIGLGIIIIRKIPHLSRLSNEEIVNFSQQNVNWKELVIDFKKIRKIRPNAVAFKDLFRNIIIVFMNIFKKLIILISRIKTKKLTDIILKKPKEWIRALSERYQRRDEEKKKEIESWTEPIKKEKTEVLEKETEASDILEEKVEIIKEFQENNQLKAEENYSSISGEKISSVELAANNETAPLSELNKPTLEEQKLIDLIVANPKNITAYKCLGVLYWQRHNYADAKASLETAIKLGSRDKKIKQILDELKDVEVL